MVAIMEARYANAGYDYLWEEIQFELAYPSIDQNEITMDEFYERLKLIPRRTRYVRGDDVHSEVVAQQIMDEAPWRILFQGTVFREEDPDQLGL